VRIRRSQRIRSRNNPFVKPRQPQLPTDEEGEKQNKDPLILVMTAPPRRARAPRSKCTRI
jgi:hypothetical protein